MDKVVDCSLEVNKFKLQSSYYVCFQINTLAVSQINPPAIALMSRVFVNGPGDWASIPRRVIPKTQKMVLDATLLNTQHYKIRIKSKVEQSKEWSSTFPYTLAW